MDLDGPGPANPTTLHERLEPLRMMEVAYGSLARGAWWCATRGWRTTVPVNMLDSRPYTQHLTSFGTALSTPE
jgi:hypothetical protein